MTRDDIIRMAREAGAYLEFAEDDFGFDYSQLEVFAALVAAAAREACARIAEDWDSDLADPREVASAIRARGQA